MQSEPSYVPDKPMWDFSSLFSGDDYLESDVPDDLFDGLNSDEEKDEEPPPPKKKKQTVKQRKKAESEAKQLREWEDAQNQREEEMETEGGRKFWEEKDEGMHTNANNYEKYLELQAKAIAYRKKNNKTIKKTQRDKILAGFHTDSRNKEDMEKWRGVCNYRGCTDQKGENDRTYCDYHRNVLEFHKNNKSIFKSHKKKFGSNKSRRKRKKSRNKRSNFLMENPILFMYKIRRKSKKK